MGSFFYYLVLSSVLFVSFILILLILIQKGRGGGLSGAFGGSGGSTAFGTKTGDVLTWATSILFGLFIALAVTLNLVVNHNYQPSNATGPSSMPMTTLPGVPSNPTPAALPPVPVQTPTTTK